MNKVFIGSDPRQPLSVTVLAHSIWYNAKKPVLISPLILDQVPLQRVGLTEFTFSRFLVPYLCNYEGWALFMDADMLLLDDINKLFDMADDQYSVMVIKNKMKFEWASVILFNCAKCTMLTPAFIETADKLHIFDFLSDDQVGALPSEWNHLVGYDAPRPDAKLVHYTQGVPGFSELRECKYAAEWHAAMQNCGKICQWDEILASSVHSEQIGNQIMPKLIAEKVLREI